MQLNEDIIGSIEMVSQTGYFSIPVKCLTKKCLVIPDKTTVDFGSVCLGETVHKRIILTNEGALSTTFKLTTELPQAEQPPAEVDYIIMHSPFGCHTLPISPSTLVMSSESC